MLEVVVLCLVLLGLLVLALLLALLVLGLMLLLLPRARPAERLTRSEPRGEGLKGRGNSAVGWPLRRGRRGEPQNGRLDDKRAGLIFALLALLVLVTKTLEVRRGGLVILVMLLLLLPLELELPDLLLEELLLLEVVPTG